MQNQSGMNTAGCEEQLRFEMLLVDLSARFVRLSAEQVDAEIEDAQRRVCECLGLDLSALWQWEADTPDTFVMTHLYRPLPGPPVPDRMEASVHHPWSLLQVQAGEMVVISSMDDLPEGAEQELEAWTHYSIKTCLTIPLVVGNGTPFGAISYNDMLNERIWTEPLIQRLELITQVFANALVRARTELALRQSETRMTMAAASAGAGLWSLNLETNNFWLTQQAREQFNLAPDESVTFDRLIQLVHPEDRESIHQTLESIVAEKTEGHFEYRVIDADGSIRWMTSRGRLQCDAPGEEHRFLMGVTVEVTERKLAEEKLKQALAEVESLRERLENENIYLRNQILHESGYGTIIGNSEPVREMIALAKKVAPLSTAVLISGETGTGKELLAQAIHDLSDRKKRPMIKVNCAALPAALIESELFGREKGAYTGAMTQQVGRFEIANGSTIFLDEIGELPLELQSKLLCVLQDGQFQRLGSHRTITTDVRVIAATNRNLDEMVAAGTFREDLYHRLNVFPIESPPLRKRTEDIPLLVWKFVGDLNVKMGRSIDSVAKPVMARLRQYRWPGNVRELRNVIERAMIITDGRALKIDGKELAAGTTTSPVSLEEMERGHILSVLDQTGWRISGSKGAAEILGLLPTTLHARLKKLGLSRPAR